MAEVAAGLWAAEEVVSTTVEAGVAAYFVTKPTLPLKATLTRIATSTDDSTKQSLSRSGHTVSLINDRAYIFGGITSSGKLADVDVHVLTILAAPESHGPLYTILPGVPSDETNARPAPRTRHAACTLGDVCIAIFGGMDENEALIEESCDFWLFNIEKGSWQALEAVDDKNRPEPRSGATLVQEGGHLFLIGGVDAAGRMQTDCWSFDVATKSWARLTDLPTACNNVTLADHKIYAISATDEVSGQIHFLSCPDAVRSVDSKWTTFDFPAHPLAGGPSGRVGAGLVPVSTGHGRQYLLFLFGSKELGPSDTAGPETRPLFSDLWAFQLPSKASELKPTVHVGDVVQGAQVKDKIRGATGLETYQHQWSEVEILPPQILDESQGKLHPGPRAYPACAVLSDGKRVFFWGGTNPKGECEGDGWLIDIA